MPTGFCLHFNFSWCCFFCRPTLTPFKNQRKVPSLCDSGPSQYQGQAYLYIRSTEKAPTKGVTINPAYKKEYSDRCRYTYIYFCINIYVYCLGWPDMLPAFCFLVILINNLRIFISYSPKVALALGHNYQSRSASYSSVSLLESLSACVSVCMWVALFRLLFCRFPYSAPFCLAYSQKPIFSSQRCISCWLCF